jgi:ribosomal protein S18 acetylase RimI-like enzyme
MGMDGVVLRPATEADLDVIASIWHEGASLPGVGPVALPPVDVLRRRIDDELAEGWDLTIAELRGEVIGFIALRCDQGVLDQLFVRPGSAGKGVGKALFAHAQAMMPAGFSLFTRPGNTRARRFYEALGMTVSRHDIHPRFGDAIVFYEWTPA